MKWNFHSWTFAQLFPVTRSEEGKELKSVGFFLIWFPYFNPSYLKQIDRDMMHECGNWRTAGNIQSYGLVPRQEDGHQSGRRMNQEWDTVAVKGESDQREGVHLCYVKRGNYWHLFLGKEVEPILALEWAIWKISSRDAQQVFHYLALVKIEVTAGRAPDPPSYSIGQTRSFDTPWSLS